MEGGKDTLQWEGLLEQKEGWLERGGLAWGGHRRDPITWQGVSLGRGLDVWEERGGLGLTAAHPALLCPAQPQGAPVLVRQEMPGLGDLDAPASPPPLLRPAMGNSVGW